MPTFPPKRPQKYEGKTKCPRLSVRARRVSCLRGKIRVWHLWHLAPVSAPVSVSSRVSRVALGLTKTVDPVSGEKSGPNAIGVRTVHHKTACRAIISRALCGANLATHHPGSERGRNPSTPPCGCGLQRAFMNNPGLDNAQA